MTMTRPRKELVSIEDTPYYHIVSRCVRRTYLCGVDHTTGKDYEHRRQWIVNRIRILSSLFSIDVCSYAIMSNHFHLALKLCPKEAETWTDAEVIERWTSLYKGPLLVQKWQTGDALNQAERQTVSDCITIYRERLASLSWFMKCLNEPIAREANKEDGCTGHFWESRFKSQALLNEESLLSCMVYVDLNPVRAKMATTPENSDHTSIQERITPRFSLAEAVHQQIEQQCLRRFEIPFKPLSYFEGNITGKEQTGILFSAQDYIQLVDFTGRLVRPDKRGAISEHLPPILQRLNLSEKEWLNNATQFEQTFYRKFGRKRQHLSDTG
jgi:REP element-mobilizing transposase RayT